MFVWSVFIIIIVYFENGHTDIAKKNGTLPCYQLGWRWVGPLIGPMVGSSNLDKKILFLSTNLSVKMDSRHRCCRHRPWNSSLLLFICLLRVGGQYCPYVRTSHTRPGCSSREEDDEGRCGVWRERERTNRGMAGEKGRGNEVWSVMLMMGWDYRGFVGRGRRNIAKTQYRNY